MSGMKRGHLTRTDRRGLLLVAVAFVVLALLLWHRGGTQDGQALAPMTAADSAEMARFAAEVEADKARRAAERQGAGRSDSTTALRPFDPNTADSATMVSLGMRPWQAHNAMQYRRAGGRWRQPDDFARLYGLSDAEFQRLRPYIRIVPTADEVQSAARRTERQARADSIRALRSPKYAEGTTISLNAADTTALKGIPGIGSYYAAKICRYRERLGGFVSTAQLREVGGLPEGIERWFVIDAGETPRRIAINRATFQTLVRHPYLNYTQTLAIVRYRQKYGDLHGWDDLRLTGHFPDDSVRMMAPYFTFEK